MEYSPNLRRCADHEVKPTASLPLNASALAFTINGHLASKRKINCFTNLTLKKQDFYYSLGQDRSIFQQGQKRQG